MNKQINELRAGVILSYINLGLSTLIPFFYTPVMLKILGQSEYGLYSLSSSTVSYLTLLSFGFGSTIVRYIAKCKSEKNTKEGEAIFGFFLLLYCALAVAVSICGIIISCNVQPIFHRGLSTDELEKMKILVLIMTFNTALSFPISVFSSVITGYEKYVFRKLVDMLSTVVAPLANLIALYLGYASVGMALASTVIQFLMLPLNVIYCTKHLKIRPRFSRLPKILIREMLNFSIFIFIGSIVDMLFWATDKVILGMMASSVAVAVYNVGATFNNMVMSVSSSLSGVLMPRITGMVVKKQDTNALTELFIKAGRLQFIVVALIVSGFVVFGQQFIELWAGAEYKQAYWVAILTMFPLCIPLIQSTGHSIVVAQNKHQFRSIVYLIIAVANVISTYITVPTMGIIGAALCSCVAYLIGQGVIMNWYYYVEIQIDIPLFWKNIAKMSIVPVAMLICCLAMKNILAEINSWKAFFSAVVIYTIIYSFFMYRFVLNTYEKELITVPVCKLLNKFRHK